MGSMMKIVYIYIYHMIFLENIYDSPVMAQIIFNVLVIAVVVLFSVFGYHLSFLYPQYHLVNISVKNSYVINEFYLIKRNIGIYGGI